MSSPSSRKENQRERSWWVQIMRWLWKAAGFLGTAVLLSLLVNIVSTWLTSPQGVIPGNSPFGWLVVHWPITMLAGCLMLLLAMLTWVLSREQGQTPIATELSQQNREHMLQRLRRSYNDLLAQSLQERAWLELGLSSKPDAVQSQTRLLLHFAPRELSKEQRLVLRNLVERSRDLRGKAMFALGYWAGCRVSDVSYLLMKHTQVGRKIGKLHVGHKGEKYRDINLLNTAREPLYEYLQKGKRARESHYVFTSQRETLPVPEGELDGWRLGEAAIHEWFKQLKATATEAEAPFIRDVTFHDLRHDFAHRAKKEAGLDDGELAVYLGHIAKRGTPAIQTTARYTQPGMDQIREKLKGMKGM